MIRAEKDPFLDNLFYWYVRRLLRKQFYMVHAAGLDHLRNLDRTRSVIAFANHTSWWDGLVVFFLTRFQPRKEFYCMMEEKQLRHYKFFRWLGAFSVDPDNRVRAAATVRYSMDLLKNSKTCVWIFPQGLMENPHVPVKVRPGVDFLATRNHNAVMLPLAIRYEFVREQRPEIFLRFGAPFPARESSDKRIEQELQVLVDQLEKDCVARNWEGYEKMMRPSWSVNKVWELFLFILRGKFRDFRSAN